MNAICLITLRPNKIWCDFLNLFTQYKIFIIVDDCKLDLHDFINIYHNITFIQIGDNKCKDHGFVKISFIIKKLISGWDKAVYYFTVENKNYDFVWFIEDDIFFYNEKTLLKIDNKYVDDDLLSNRYFENENGSKHSWHWDNIHIEYQPPYYCGMMCAVRFSKKMMNSIHNYATKHKTLFYLEALFPTIAIKNNLKYSIPNEFKKIYFKYEFDKEDINEFNLYHPIKNMDDHISFRDFLDKNAT
jgi:hypothetical protein